LLIGGRGKKTERTHSLVDCKRREEKSFLLETTDAAAGLKPADGGFSRERVVEFVFYRLNKSPFYPTAVADDLYRRFS